MTTSPSDLLVVGGGGFVGAAVVRHLAARGHRVTVLDPVLRAPLPAGAVHVAASVSDAAPVLRALRPAAVLNFAAHSAGAVGLAKSGEAEPEAALRVNTLGFHSLLQAAADAGLRRVFWASSTVVLGAAENLDTRLAEDAPCRPLSTYGLSKLMAEQVADFMARRHGMAITGLRLPLIFGPGLWYQGAAAALNQLVAAAAPGAAPELAVPSVPFDAMHVADVARAFALLLDSTAPLRPLYHLAGFTTRWAEIAATLAAMVPGYRPLLREAPAPVVYPLVSQRLLEQDTGFAIAHDLRATLADMLAARGGEPAA